MSVYLDYQATTPLAPEALAAMLPWLDRQHANPHSAHAEGRAAKAAVEAARAEVAALLPPGGAVGFTGGATEAINWAIKGAGRDVLGFATEHAAVLDCARPIEAQGRRFDILPVDREGRADLDALHGHLTAGKPSPTRHSRESGNPASSAAPLVAAMLVNNEIGAIHPVAEIAEQAHAAGALVLCDAVQGYGRVPIPATCDLVAISAHKIHGPKGIGALWIRDGIDLAPLLHGGGQEASGRSGTLSPALCAGFGAAARLMRERREQDAAHIERLWQVALDILQSPLPSREGAGVGGERSEPRWTLNGSTDHRYQGNLNIRREGLDVARLMSELRDISFSAGSACASGSGRPSHVLKAIGLSDAAARSSIRLGFGRYTGEAELVEALTRIDAAARAQRIAA
ncbi:cysteine desulfurase [Sphingomonas gilva]|uniref:Cysteine desulfurase n=1 Tax=Sphingomonas gilva TaxID=2305907 RepID=A0A396RJZ1_9SPHN|nr:cysteine desulfurase family protein [Sphingomonas gilva]RHW16480.1 cysteine desulfurase [Sphingomonas gilva]